MGRGNIRLYAKIALYLKLKKQTVSKLWKPFISLAVSSSSLPYISNYYYDSQYEWLKISISKNNTTKVCGNIDISKTNLQYKLLCGKENGKGLIPLDKIKFHYEKSIFSAQSTTSGKVLFSVSCTQEQCRDIEKYIEK